MRKLQTRKHIMRLFKLPRGSYDKYKSLLLGRDCYVDLDNGDVYAADENGVLEELAVAEKNNCGGDSAEQVMKVRHRKRDERLARKCRNLTNLPAVCDV